MQQSRVQHSRVGSNGLSKSGLIGICLSLLIMTSSVAGNFEREKDFDLPPRAQTQEVRELVRSKLSQHKISQHTLRNGVRVVVCELPPDGCEASIRFFLDVGSMDELPHQRGVAHMLEHMMWKGSTKKDGIVTRSEGDLRAIISKIGGYHNAATCDWCTTYYFDVPSSQWKIPLQLFADSFANCDLHEDYFRSELTVVLEEIMKGAAYNRGMELLSLHPGLASSGRGLGDVGGLPSDIFNRTIEDVREFYETMYTPEKLTVVVVASVAANEVLEVVDQLFGQIASVGGGTDMNDAPIPLPPVSSTVNVFFADGYTQADVITITTLRERGVNYFIPEIFCQYMACVIRRELEEVWGDSGVEVTASSDRDRFFAIMRWRVSGSEPSRVRLLTGGFESIMARYAFELDRPLFDEAVRAIVSQAGMMAGSANKISRFLGFYYCDCEVEAYPCSFLLDSEVDDLRSQVSDWATKNIIPSVFEASLVTSASDAVKARVKERSKLINAFHDKIIKSLPKRESEVESSGVVNQYEPFVPDEIVFPDEKIIKIGDTLDLSLVRMPHAGESRIVLVPDFGLLCNGVTTPEELVLLFKMMLLEVDTVEKSPGTKLEELNSSYGVAPHFLAVCCHDLDISQAMGILGESFANVSLSEKNLKKAKERFANVLQAAQLDSVYSYRVLLDLIYGGMAKRSRLLWDPKRVDKITISDIRELYHRVVHGKKRLLIVGGTRALDSELVQMVEQLFVAKMRRNATNEYLEEDVEAEPVSVASDKVVTSGKNVVHIGGLSLALNDPDCAYLSILEKMIFSELFKLRERHGLFYTPMVFCAVDADLEPGHFSVSVEVSEGRFDEVKAKICDLLLGFQDRITESALVEAKSACLGGLPKLFSQNPASISTLLVGMHNAALNTDWIKNCLLREIGATVDDLKRVASRLFRSENIFIKTTADVNAQQDDRAKEASVAAEVGRAASSMKEDSSPVQVVSAGEVAA